MASDVTYREQIARIIDPIAWLALDEGLDAPGWKEKRNMSLRKTDQIIALSPAHEAVQAAIERLRDAARYAAKQNNHAVSGRSTQGTYKPENEQAWKDADAIEAALSALQNDG